MKQHSNGILLTWSSCLWKTHNRILEHSTCLVRHRSKRNTIYSVFQAIPYSEASQTIPMWVYVEKMNRHTHDWIKGESNILTVGSVCATYVYSGSVDKFTAFLFKQPYSQHDNKSSSNCVFRQHINTSHATEKLRHLLRFLRCRKI